MTARPARAVLTAVDMRAVESDAMKRGLDARTLMERGGQAAARAILAFDPVPSAVVLCGPGNNGGDGYVVARHLRDAGVAVTIAAAAPPRRNPAWGAFQDWGGTIAALAEVPPAAALIDALYGISLSRPLDDEDSAALSRLAPHARLKVALDLPSYVATDSGALLVPPSRSRAAHLPWFDLTVALGALKPAHLLEPARSRCGRIVVADLGLGPLPLWLTDNPEPHLPRPDPATHKYARGHVLSVGGPSGHGGAARLAALAALRAGAGVATIAVPKSAVAENAARLDAPMLRAIDDGAALTALIAEGRVSALVVGPGLGKDARAAAMIDAALASGRPLVLDGDGLTHFERNAARLTHALRGPVVLTPHEGEFRRVFGEPDGTSIERARTIARLTGAIIVLKGPATVIAHPDGRARVNVHASPALATAGSGDVLAGIIAGLLAGGGDAFGAACAGVWLHGDAGVRGGTGLTADDLPELLPATLAGLG